MQIENPSSASFSFETDADKICLVCISAKAGLGSKAFVDGIELGEASCYSPWQSMNYTTPWITLPKGTKHIRFEIENAHEDATVFRFGYVIECFEA